MGRTGCGLARALLQPVVLEVGFALAVAVFMRPRSLFVHDEEGQLLGEYDVNGAPVYETIYLATAPVRVMKQAGSEWCCGCSPSSIELEHVEA